MPARPWWHRIPPPSAPQVFLAGAVIAWTWYFAARSLDIHHALGTSSYDSALYDQGMWLLSRVRRSVRDVDGSQSVRRPHLVHPAVARPACTGSPPGAWIMFTAQSAAIAAGAIPVFLYGRRRLGSEWLALIGAGTYLLHPAVGWTNLENFHPGRIPRRVRRLRASTAPSNASGGSMRSSSSCRCS